MSTDLRSLDLRPHHGSPDDGIIADRARSELGSLLKALDQTRMHLFVSDGIVTVHGDVSDHHVATAIEARLLQIAGVRGVRSHLHVGLLPGDTVPSVGHRHERSPLRVQLEKAVRNAGFWSEPEINRALSGVLGVFSRRLTQPARERFLAHLPSDVRQLARAPRWLEDNLTSVRREHDFAQTVALAVGTDTQRADTLVRHLLPPLRRHAPEDEPVIAAALPPELRAIWSEQPDAASATGQIARQGTGAGTRRRRERPHRRSAEDRPVSDVMTRDVISVTPQESVFAAFDLMRAHRIHHLPVVRPDGHCVAILDAVAIAERMPEAWVTRGATPVWHPRAIGPLSFLADTSLRRAAIQMDAAAVDASCVVDEHGRFIGLLTCRDIIAAVAGRAHHDQQ